MYRGTSTNGGQSGTEKKRSENNLELRDQDFPISWKLKEEISLTGPHTKIKVLKI